MASRVRANTYPQDATSSSTKVGIPKSKTIDDYIRRDISKETSLDLVREVLTLLNITKLFMVFSRQLVRKQCTDSSTRRAMVRTCYTVPDPAIKSVRPILSSPLGNCFKCERTIPFVVECEHCAMKQLFYCANNLCWIEHLRRMPEKETYIDQYPLTIGQPWVVCVLCRTALLTQKFMDIHQLPRYRVIRGVLGTSVPVFKLMQEKAKTSQSGKFFRTCDLEDSCIEEDFRLTKLTPSDCPNCMRSRRVIFLCRPCNVLYISKELRPDYIVYSDYECPRHYYEQKYGKDWLSGAESDMGGDMDRLKLQDPPKKGGKDEKMQH